MTSMFCTLALTNGISVMITTPLNTIPHTLVNKKIIIIMMLPLSVLCNIYILVKVCCLDHSLMNTAYEGPRTRVAVIEL